MKRLILFASTLVALLGLLNACGSDNGDTNGEDPIAPANDFSLQSPQNGASNITQGVTLRWESAGTGVTYRLMVATTPDLSNPIIDQSGLTDTQYVIQNDFEWNAVVYWSVYATKNDFPEKQAQNGIFNFEIEPQGVVSPSPLISKYYVSPSGEDNAGNGSSEEPFKTIAFAARNVPVNENDTIFILNGIYIEVEPIILPLGTNLIGESTDGVIIQSDGVALPPDFVLDDKIEDQYQYALIQMISSEVEDGNHEVAYFTLDGAQKQLEAGVWGANRNNIALHHVKIQEVKYRGVSIGTSEKLWFRPPETYIQGIEVHHCNFVNSGQDLEEYSTGNLNLGQLEGAEIHNISILDDTGYGIKFLWDGYFKDCYFHDITTDLSETDVLWGEDIGIELWNLGPGNFVENIESNTWLSLVNHPYVFPNLGEELNLKLINAKIVDKNGTSQKEGLEIGTPHVEISNCFVENKAIGLALWNMGHNNVTIHHNIFRNNNPIANWAGGSGIYIDNSRDWDFDDINIFNNILDSFVYGVRVRGDKLNDIAIKNNLFIDNQTADLDIADGNITFAHNYRHTLSSEDWTFFGDMNSYNNDFGDAEIQSSGNFQTNFYRPTSGSPLLNAGEDVGLPFTGDAPNIGVFED